MNVVPPGLGTADALARLAMNGALAIVLGLVIGWVYARAYRGILLSTSFVHTCAVTVLLVAFAVAAVREAGERAEALGFALVGLLGLIRFRTVVRDTREFSFVFVAIVTGVMVGSNLKAAAVLGCGAALALLIALERTGFGTPSSLALRARVTGEPDQLASYAEALRAVAERVEPSLPRPARGEDRLRLRARGQAGARHGRRG